MLKMDYSKIKIPFLSLLIVLGFFNVLSGQVELGNVDWNRDYEQALSQSNKSNKPLLILFQEVPGCSTCQNFGKNVLSDKLIVEAIEDNFVPVAVFNNKGGKDKEVLNLYQEPSWNNPVMRISLPNGKTIRNSGSYDAVSIIDFISRGLLENNLMIPLYLSNLRKEYSLKTGPSEELTLGMFCFWSGEKELGSLEGVTSTSAGWMGGKEVVKVTYNPEVLPTKKLIAKADKKNMANYIFTNDSNLEVKNINPLGKYRLDKDQKYYLKKSKYADVEMSEYQRMLVNAALGAGGNPEYLLSPRQRLSVH